MDDVPRWPGGRRRRVAGEAAAAAAWAASSTAVSNAVARRCTHPVHHGAEPAHGCRLLPCGAAAANEGWAAAAAASGGGGCCLLPARAGGLPRAPMGWLCRLAAPGCATWAARLLSGRGGERSSSTLLQGRRGSAGCKHRLEQVPVRGKGGSLRVTATGQPAGMMLHMTRNLFCVPSAASWQCIDRV